ncbi:hypothetical protein HanIR_Chr06g0262761 [Helianthus annuus]|nr:hypothetical protein HanIR_Chr06g0262761 [Helianthus annuus]
MFWNCLPSSFYQNPLILLQVVTLFSISLKPVRAHMVLHRIHSFSSAIVD